MAEFLVITGLIAYVMYIVYKRTNEQSNVPKGMDYIKTLFTMGFEFFFNNNSSKTNISSDSKNGNQVNKKILYNLSPTMKCCGTCTYWTGKRDLNSLTIMVLDEVGDCTLTHVKHMKEKRCMQPICNAKHSEDLFQSIGTRR